MQRSQFFFNLINYHPGYRFSQLVICYIQLDRLFEEPYCKKKKKKIKDPVGF